jgi:hypothetical protein
VFESGISSDLMHLRSEDLQGMMDEFSDFI